MVTYRSNINAPPKSTLRLYDDDYDLISLYISYIYIAEGVGLRKGDVWKSNVTHFDKPSVIAESVLTDLNQAALVEMSPCLCISASQQLIIWDTFL